MSKTLFLSLAPNAINESGHDIIYQKCLESAAKQLDLLYFGLLPQQSEVKQLQKNWRPFFRRNKFLKCLDFCRAFSIQREKVIFIESFNTSDLIYLTLGALLFSRKRDRLCLLLRYGLNQLRQQGAIHILMAKLCKMRLGSRFVLLTDSELIAQECKKHFKEPLIVVPIPHGEAKIQWEDKNNKIICWWPGIPRAAKGLNELVRIAQLPRDVKRVELVAARQSQLPNTTLIPDVLSREEYLFWLHASDCILLPYDPIVYRSGTSGIFVEAILAGKIPLVKEGSWLAHELFRHGLDELIIDWNDREFFSKIEALSCTASVQEKLQKMGDVYSKFHSHDPFSEQLRVACRLKKS